jgi:hypothetical protein
MIPNFIQSFIDRITSAAATKAKQKTVGKAQGKVMGAQAKAQQKALRAMDGGFEKVENRAKQGVSGFQGDPQQQQATGNAMAAPGPPMPGGVPQQHGHEYQATNQAYAPVVGNSAPMPTPGVAGDPNACPSCGAALDPSWDVCPYCAFNRSGQAKSGVHVEALSQGMAEGKTVALNAAEIVGNQHVNKAVVGWLVCMDGDQKGQDYRLFDGRNVLGTAADCEIVVYDQWVSARHSVILIESGKARYLIQDLDSKNHTFVNTKQVMKQELIDNDEVRIGRVKFRFKSLY